MKNKRFLFLFAAIMAFGASAKAGLVKSAVDAVVGAVTKSEPSGVCGVKESDCSYKINDKGVLTIKGNGEMILRPWQGEDVKAVVIEEGIKSISSYAFSNMSDVSGIKIPDSVQTIGWGAFQGSSMVVAFGKNSKLKTIENFAFADTKLNLSMESILPPLLPLSKLKNIGQSAFKNSNFKAVYTPTGVKTIRTSVFANNRDMKCIDISSSVKKIEGQAFAGCSAVGCAVISENVEEIGPLAFDEIAPSELIIGSDQIQMYLDAGGSLKNISKLYCSDGADACKAVLTKMDYKDVADKTYSSVYSNKALKYAKNKTKADFCPYILECKLESLAK